MKTEGEPAIRRILVALDASPQSRNALQAAVELASRLKAEITGLFVEDINLLRVTEYSFVREIGAFSTGFQRLEIQQLERHFRAEAEQMRRMLAVLAEREQVPWHFRVTRGAVASEILSAGTEADLVILGKIGRSLVGGKRIGSTVRTVVLQRSGLTLILERNGVTADGAATLAIYDGSDSARKGLKAGAHLAAVRNGYLKVLVLGEEREESRRRAKEAEEIMGAYSIRTEIRILIDPSLPDLTHLVRMETIGPIVLPCGRENLQGEALCTIINNLPNPVLLVR
jgi:nucleotide-binding universal stress UspA family protein